MSAPRSVVAEIVEALRADLHHGVLVAGQAVRERDIAERFGVSRTPAREAINRLIAEGLLTHGDGLRGVTVVRPTASELRELYEIRLQLEPMAAALAAEHATQEALDDIALQVRRLDDCDGYEFMAGHLALHLSIAEAADRPLLLGLIRNLRTRSDPYVRLYLGMGQREEAQADHRKIVDALVRRRAEEAARITADHLRRTIEKVEPFLATHDTGH